MMTLQLSSMPLEAALIFNSAYFLAPEHKKSLTTVNLESEDEELLDCEVEEPAYQLTDQRSTIEEYQSLVTSVMNSSQGKDPTIFKLPTSKSPIMEALVYCSINKYGIELTELNRKEQRIVFSVTDFLAYYRHSCSICSKQSPSDDIRARMKTLQRWFTSFPCWKDLDYPFQLLVRPSHYLKMHEIITKMVQYYEGQLDRSVLKM